MPVDFVHTKTPEKKPVFHIFFMCPSAQDIDKADKVYSKPPAGENRVLCEKCRELATVQL